MENSGFKIIGVSIEGFKGFTTKQTVSIDGKHLFLLGPNGYGKSSVLEAIRWGLFGSTKHKGETVLNQHYAGACRVELALNQGGKNYRLRRTLIRGITGGSYARLFDESGQELNLGEVMPQLDSAAAGEAMHLVFTAQAVKQKRSVEDLEPFETTLYSYLGLTDARLAITQLEKFVLEQDVALDRLGKQLGESEHKIDTHVAAIEDSRDAILANPPWGDQTTPALEQTKQKIVAFGKELAVLIGAPEPPDAADLDTLLQIAERFVSQASSLSEEAQAKELVQVEHKIENLREASEKWRVALSNLAEVRSNLSTKEKELLDLLDGKTIDQIETELKEATTHLEEIETTEEIKQLSATLLSGRSAGGQPTECPVCNVPMQQDVVTRIITEAEESGSQKGGMALKREQLKALFDRLTLNKHEILTQDNLLRPAETALEQTEQTLASELQAGTGTNFEVETGNRMEDLVRQVEAFNRQIENAKEADSLRRAVLLNLQNEVRFHKLLSQHRRVQGKQEDLRRAKENLESLVELRESTFKISSEMNNALLNELRASLGPVDEALTESFVALTQHPAYDRIFVDQDLLPKLQLKVGSTTDPQGKWDDSVLNGQAASALGLVPYFAFSQLTDMPFEVHVMLLDDPTQSFDRVHIETLVEKLSQVGQRVQLVISSHELEPFEEFIPKYFPDTSHKVVELTKFSIKDGPAL